MNDGIELATLNELAQLWPNFEVLDSEVLTGIYHDPYALFTVHSSGEKM